MTQPKNYLMDMDGVLVRGRTMIPGADEFIQRLRNREAKFLVLTNNSRYTPRDLAHRLRNSGLDIPPESIFTSALATARFLASQRPNGTAYVVGESGLTQALYEVGYVVTDQEPDYVVIGETSELNFRQLTKAVRLVSAGARFVGTNPDTSGPTEHGPEPGCGAVAALIEMATGIKPFFVGKPNPLMMRTALKYLGVHSADTIMIGDRMDTDIVAGVETGLETILVLTGVTQREDVGRFPYRPVHVVESVAEIPF